MKNGTSAARKKAAVGRAECQHLRYEVDSLHCQPALPRCVECGQGCLPVGVMLAPQ